ncbi:MAG: cation:proton antiporter, partial [Cyanobacteria bacterium P01_D01_bin.56]
SLETYTVANLLKALLIVAIGWLIYAVVIRPIRLELPLAAERFEHLVGAMSLMLVLLFTMVLV